MFGDGIRDGTVSMAIAIALFSISDGQGALERQRRRRADDTASAAVAPVVVVDDQIDMRWYRAVPILEVEDLRKIPWHIS